MPRRWSGLARVAVTGLAGGSLACAGRLGDVERKVRRDRVVLVGGDRITAIQPATTKIPAGARVIDLPMDGAARSDRLGS